MKIPTLFKEYIWLIEAINEAGKITFAEINERWVNTEMSGGVELARTTFNRHRDAIMDMFGVIIDCDRKDGYRYYIYNKEVLREDSVANWLYSTLSVGNMLDDSVGVQDRILIESVPSGNVHLKQIIKAMRESRMVMLTYRRYGAASANSFSAAPYCVKLFKRRWYVLVRIERPSYNENKGRNYTMAIFSLDRLEDVMLQQEKFVMDMDFDVEEYFNECFGIVVGDGTKPERIVLRAYGQEPYYMRDLPLHHSQREINETEEYTDFELYLRPTPDFKAHIMSRGEWVQVISPKRLALDVQNLLQAVMNRYKKGYNKEKVSKK
ncbi:MAG: WYL domain-containing protein [Prevotella sp.]|nr:WYL domain-containing protein [Prevotella sp.]